MLEDLIFSFKSYHTCPRLSRRLRHGEEIYQAIEESTNANNASVRQRP